MTGTTRLEQQLRFIMEIDKLKQVFRKSMITDRSRYENDAEHTWHLTIMSVVLLEHANQRDLNLLRVIKMLLIHDIVEIDAGDTFAYDDHGHLDKQEREEKAAIRIFGLLPEDQRSEFMELWQEFERRQTVEARYAAALDRLQPMLFNYHNEGHTWKKFGITSDRVLKRNQHIEEGSAALWEYAKEMLEDAIAKGYLDKPAEG